MMARQQFERLNQFVFILDDSSSERCFAQQQALKSLFAYEQMTQVGMLGENTNQIWNSVIDFNQRYFQDVQYGRMFSTKDIDALRKLVPKIVE